MITILDTTLRDGGYLNDWNFGKNAIFSIVDNLFRANIDYIELGFLSDKKTNADKTIFNSLNIDFLHENILNKTCLMLKAQDFDISKLKKRNEKSVSKIRYIFKKKQEKRALDECAAIIELGYDLFVNPVFIDDYSKKDYYELAEKINILKPYAYSVVDSMGTFKKDYIRELFTFLDKNMNKEIFFGFHCHNNSKNALNNTLTLLDLKLNRKIIIDCTVLGMGRGAGNIETEVFAKSLNENYLKKYDINFLEKIKKDYIQCYYQKRPWGVNDFYLICAQNACHSNYADFLIRNNFPLKNDALKKIFKSIPQDKKTTYDEEVIKKILKEYKQL